MDSQTNTSFLVCTALSFNLVRVAWMFETIAYKDVKTSYALSWFAVEELSEEENLRDVIDYEYENELLRYNYGSSYTDLLESFASSLAPSSFHHVLVDDIDFFEITIGLVSNRTLDVAIRRIFESTNRRPDEVPRDNNPLQCKVKIPVYEGERTTTASSLSPDKPDELWMWVVIAPGILLTTTVIFISMRLIQRVREKLRRKSKVGLIASSWQAISDAGGRHWVVPQRESSPSSRASMLYTRSSLVSGVSEVWDQLHHSRCPLPTVDEEAVADLPAEIFSQPRAVISPERRRYGQNRISNPQVSNIAPEKLWLMQTNPSEGLNSRSTSPWWPDEGAEQQENEGTKCHSSTRMMSSSPKKRRLRSTQSSMNVLSPW